MEEAELGDRVLGPPAERLARSVRGLARRPAGGLVFAPGRRVRAEPGGVGGGVRPFDPGHHDHRTSLGGAATEIGCGPVPGGCPCSRTVTLVDWQPNRASPILSPWPTALPDRLGPRPARGGPGFRPRRPSLRDPGWAARAIRSPTRSASSARCSGQVIAEQAGPELFALVERIRRRTIALRRGDPDLVLEPDIERERLGAEIASLDVEHAAAVARAFTLYFQLVNLAEERQRVRVLRTRARRAKGRPIDESLGEAVERLARRPGPGRDRGAAPHGRGPPGPHRPPDRGPATHAADRPAADPAAARHARRPADHARRGRRPPAPPARGDHAAVAHRRPAGGAAHAAGRGPIGARDLRRDAVHRRPPLRPGAGPGARRGRAAGGRSATTDAGAGRRRGAHGDAGRRRAGRAPVRVVDRVGPRRAPGRDRGHHPPRGAPPGRPPAARLRGGRRAADADGRRTRGPRSRRPGARPRAGARRRGAARDHAPAPAPLPRGAVPPAAGRDRGAAAPDPRGPHRRGRGAQPAATRARTSSTPSWRRSSTRWSRTGSAAWPGARWPSCAGSWRRSASTSRRSRSASTPRSTGPRSRRCGGARIRRPRSPRASRWPRCWPRSARSRGSRRGSASRRAGGT